MRSWRRVSYHPSHDGDGMHHKELQARARVQGEQLLAAYASPPAPLFRQPCGYVSLSVPFDPPEHAGQCRPSGHPIVPSLY
jgi:hypothetical protein